MTSDDQPTAPPQLIRALGRWSMVALAINSILGSGVFGLPSVVAGLLGAASPAAVLVAGIAMVVIIACYAEVASQFDATGGTYLYLRHAFGRLIGLQVGWMALLSRLTACAAAVNLLSPISPSSGPRRRGRCRASASSFCLSARWRRRTIAAPAPGPG
jgi:amino acid transporter